MTSAPRSASIWVPKGPAPNWEIARIRSPSSGARLMSVGQPTLAEGGVALLGDQDGSRIGADCFASLVHAQGLHRDDTAVALARLPHLEHSAPHVECIADKGRFLVLEGVHFEVGNGPARDVGHRH